jgi:TrmH family RNA methyltransferase
MEKPVPPDGWRPNTICCYNRTKQIRKRKNGMITGRNNDTIKQIRALQQRKERERTGVFFIEGIRIVVEAIQQHIPLEMIVVAPDLLSSQLAQDLVQKQKAQGIQYLEVTAEVFKRISTKENPQGLGAIVRQRWEQLEESKPDKLLCWTALYKIQDPGNLGTIIRTSDATGGAGIILLDNTVDPYDITSVRASMGAIFSQKLIRTNFADLRAWKQKHHYILVGTADSAAQEYRSVDYRQPLILLMGSEPAGLPELYQQACDVMVKLPMVGRSDSLNLAVATGVVLYEIFYQKQDMSTFPINPPDQP